MRSLILWCFVSTLFAVQVPDWVKVGILHVETKSFYDDVGRVVYIDQTRGHEGEIGPWQMKRIAFDTVALPGERFARLQTDTEFAERIFVRYIEWLYDNEANKDWATAVRCYNKGPSAARRGTGSKYLTQVRSAAAQTG